MNCKSVNRTIHNFYQWFARGLFGVSSGFARKIKNLPEQIPNKDASVLGKLKDKKTGEIDPLKMVLVVYIF